jgi:hypothetical protein
VLDADLPDDALPYESRTQCSQRPTDACEAQLTRVHLRVTNDRDPYIRSEHKRMRRSPRRLQTKDPVPLKALETAPHAAPTNTQRTGDLDFAEATAACQYNLRPPSNLKACPARQDIKPLLYFIAEWSHGLAAALPVCLGKRQPAQQLAQPFDAHLLNDSPTQNMGEQSP